MQTNNVMTAPKMAGRSIMSLAQLKAKAPSVFATHASKKMSEHYAFVPSMHAVEALGKMGLVPVDAGQRKAKGDPTVARHMVRFAFKDDLTKARTKGDYITEVVMVNSHNGRTAFKLYYGLFRFICANGLIVGDNTVGMTRRHIGDVKAILAEADEILERGPTVIKMVKDMRSASLTDAQRLKFAQQAMALRYEQEETRAGVPPKLPTIVADQLLLPRRNEDKGNDLWHTFNVVQENLLVGGLTGKSALGRTTHTRQLQDVRKVVSVNTGLWELAQSMLKVAA